MSIPDSISNINIELQKKRQNNFYCNILSFASSVK